MSNKSKKIKKKNKPLEFLKKIVQKARRRDQAPIYVNADGEYYAKIQLTIEQKNILYKDTLPDLRPEYIEVPIPKEKIKPQARQMFVK